MKEVNIDRWIYKHGPEKSKVAKKKNSGGGRASGTDKGDVSA